MIDDTPQHFSVPAKKSLGQHFLNNPLVPEWMCDAAELQAGDIVMEIGPGTGALTEALLARGVQVIALETDSRSITVLEQRFASELQSGQLTVHEHDIRTGIPIDPQLQVHHFKVVANIPYYLTGYIFRTLLETKHQPKTIVCLVQKEIAERVARSQKHSLLSLSITAFGTPKYVKTVSRNHFTPPPRVQSAILAIHNIGFHNLSTTMMGHFFHILRTGFAHKRKYLSSNLAHVWTKHHITDTFETLHIPLNVRAEDVPLTDWVQLANLLPPHKSH